MPPLEVGLSRFTSRNPAVSPFGDAEAERDEGGAQGGLEGQRPAERDRAGNCSPLATRTGPSGDWTGSPLGHQPCSLTHTASAGSPGPRVAAAALENKLAMCAELLPVLLDIGHGLAQKGAFRNFRKQGSFLVWMETDPNHKTLGPGELGSTWRALPLTQAAQQRRPPR